MTNFIFISLTCAIIAAILMSSIRLILKLDETDKYIKISFLIVALEIDLVEYAIQIVLLNRFKFDASSIYKKMPKYSTEKKSKKEKKKFSFKNIDLGYLKHLKYLISKIKIDRLMINIEGSILDPFNTGRIYGLYWALKGMFSQFMSHINFNPSFSTDKIKIDGYGNISIKLFYIIALVLKLMADIISKKRKQKATSNRRGVNYA